MLAGDGTHPGLWTAPLRVDEGWELVCILVRDEPATDQPAARLGPAVPHLQRHPTFLGRGGRRAHPEDRSDLRRPVETETDAGRGMVADPGHHPFPRRARR